MRFACAALAASACVAMAAIADVDPARQVGAFALNERCATHCRSLHFHPWNPSGAIDAPATARQYRRHAPRQLPVTVEMRCGLELQYVHATDAQRFRVARRLATAVHAMSKRSCLVYSQA